MINCEENLHLQFRKKQMLDLGVKLYSVAEYHKVGLGVFRNFGILSNLELVKSQLKDIIESPESFFAGMERLYKTLFLLGTEVLKLMCDSAVEIRAGVESGEQSDNEDVRGVIELSQDFCVSMSDLLEKVSKRFPDLLTVKGYLDAGCMDFIPPDTDQRLAGILREIYNACVQMRKTLDIVRSTLAKNSISENCKKTDHAGGYLQVYWPQCAVASSSF